MNIIKLTIAAATFTVGLAATASAMPVGKIAPGATTQAEQVRLVCNRWGHCWRTGGYYRTYGYRSYGWDRGYHRGWRHHRHWR
jgi:hypothetical protein